MSTWNADTYLKQVGLKQLGFDPGGIDGLDGKRTQAAERTWRSSLDIRRTASVSITVPKSGYSDLLAFFGLPGDEGEFVVMEFPYPMYLSWDLSVKVTRTRVHRRVAGALFAALHEILQVKGGNWIKEHKLDHFGGVYNNRKMRGGSSKSLHAWAAAIDLNPADNGNRLPWAADKIGQEGYGTMPMAAVEIFERHGFLHGGRAWGRDAMHFQYTK